MTIRHLLIMGAGILPFLYAGSARAEHGPCREYTKTISIGGRLEVGYGRACRQPDGAWEIVSLSGRDDGARYEVREHIYNDLRSGGDRVIVVERPVHVIYREPFHVHAPVRYYPAHPVFHRWSGHDEGHKHKWHKNKYHRHDWKHDGDRRERRRHGH